MSDIMTVQGLDLWYGDHQALHDISMNIPEKSITALIGPSGLSLIHISEPTRP